MTEKTEQELTRQLLLNKTITDNAASCLFMMDKQGRSTFMNPAAIKVTGYTLDEIKDMPLHDAIHHHYPDGRPYPMCECPIDNAQAELTEVVDYEDIFIRKDGNFFPVICYIAPLEENGDVVGSVLEFRDVTQQKEAEEEIRVLNNTLEQRVVQRTTELASINEELQNEIAERKKAEEELEQKKYYLEKAQEIGSIGTWELDIKENKLIWTDENYRIFGLPVGTELTYEIFMKCIHQDDRDYVDKEWRAALNNKPYDIEHRIIVDGKIKWVREKADLEFDEKGNGISGIGFTQDITERKEMEETLLDSEKLKSLGTITAGIAHEFNNILAVMVGSAELLEGGFKDEKELKKVLHDIIKAGDDGAEIVKNMLKFAKPEGEDRSDYIFFDINELLNDAIDFTAPRWRNMAQAQGIDYTIEKEGMSEIPEALCNTTELREVFINIMNNSMDAMPDGGSISFSTWSDDGTVLISISDTGKGMPEEVKRKIFDPFFTTRRPLGTGLGMSVSYSIIKRHGGRIEVESETGKGATFNLSIPIGEGTILKTVPPEPASQITTKKLNIIVVDDNEDMCVIMDSVLTRSGHTVKIANSGVKGIELVSKEDFDLVLCDLAMPDVYGYEVIKAINKLGKRPKIGIVTGWDEKLKPVDDEEFKVDFILKKPFKHAV
ncbi:MAG: PAS domain S-box protein, partial [Candidatus Scalindua sp.]|nr:PAS domain S-box protein [Candidatus Scalindua sp.]